MTAQHPSEELATGDVRTIGGKYRVLRVRGKGGMGVVYEAENTWTGRRVAVKVLDPGRTPSADRVRRFMQEARAAAQINHPNIVDVLDMGQDPGDGSHYIVQELLEGGDLRGRLQDGHHVPPREAMAIAQGVLRALVAAHERGIIHRDIKPANIMLTPGADGTVVPKLIDFGISKVTTDTASLVETSTGQILGTPAYMSPEQLRAERPVDAQTDVWAVGVVLYEMLTGALPFDAQNYNILVFKVLSEPPIPVTQWGIADISADVAAVVHRALEPARDARYPNAQTFLDDVSACLEVHPRLSAETLAGAAARASLATVPPPSRTSLSGTVKVTDAGTAARTDDQLAATLPSLRVSTVRTARSRVIAAATVTVLVAATVATLALRSRPSSTLSGGLPQHGVTGTSPGMHTTPAPTVAVTQPNPGSGGTQREPSAVPTTSPTAPVAVGRPTAPTVPTAPTAVDPLHRHPRRGGTGGGAGAHGMEPVGVHGVEPVGDGPVTAPVPAPVAPPPRHPAEFLVPSGTYPGN